MRVSLISETYFPQINGVSRTLLHQAKGLRESGDAVQLVHPNYGEPAWGDQDHLVRSVSIPFYHDLRLPVPPFRAVRRALDAFRPDVIHLVTEATLGLNVLRYALARGIPVVSCFHTNFNQYVEHYGAAWAKKPVWRYLRWFHNRTSETYVPSRVTIAELEDLGFERLVYWPRGVDSEQFRPGRPGREATRQSLGFGPDDVVIGYVSRIAAEKNVGYLVDALRLVARSRPNVRFLIVGDGPGRSEMERQMGPKARFVGYQSGDRLADHYAASDLFAFSSLTETFGNVVLEAMASGLPVVALRAGGVGEIVQDETSGILIDATAHPERMAQALIDLADDEARRRRLAEAARRHAVSQDWHALIRTLRDRYHRVIAAASPNATLAA
jgi:glycosyltransferase involved in cell wall biosynthesis